MKNNIHAKLKRSFFFYHQDPFSRGFSLAYGRPLGLSPATRGSSDFSLSLLVSEQLQWAFFGAAFAFQSLALFPQTSLSDVHLLPAPLVRTPGVNCLRARTH
jgi:hypothetical protein